MQKYLVLSFVGLLLAPFAWADRSVRVSDNQLVIDGVKQPQIFGAEVQYFRLRGGYGPNQSRDQVMQLWNRALDKVVEAKMNAVSFYIPWDFHEYQEGKFDFTGTVDEDGDGNPDYPSRDVLTFIRLIKEHGIKHIMVRPGPYINAEWGFLGFGAVPEWFHNKYPSSHMQSSWGWNTKLYDYGNPDLLRSTEAWFKAVYEQVLKPNMGEGEPIDFVQIDNETNYQWQSIYNLDYSPNAMAAYRNFLQMRYGNDLGKLNQAHQRSWSDWSAIAAPTKYGQNLGEDQDWYRFHDETIHSYLIKLRRIWEKLGVKEPNILFTLAESYNAPTQGLLPNYVLRNDAGNTGLQTVNLYPKTFDRDDHPLYNNPFKSDLDVKSAIAANAAYWGAKQEWAMGPEIQAGWWHGIYVSPAARKQTYLSVIGHGLKAFFVYYFNEGDNFGVHWPQDKVLSLYNTLRNERSIPDTCPLDELSNAFWGELQARMNRTNLIGFDARDLAQRNVAQDETLYFDAPLDGNANPRNHFYDLKTIGEKLIAPYQDFLASSVEIQDDAVFLKEAASNVPNGNGIDNVFANADWSAGLLGYLMTANLNPAIAIGENSALQEFQHKLLVHVDTGMSTDRSMAILQKSPGVLNFLGNQLAKSKNLPQGKLLSGFSSARQVLNFSLDQSGHLASAGGQIFSLTSAASPLFVYDQNEVNAAGCDPILFTADKHVAAYRCRKSDGTLLVQVGALLFDDYNSSDYGLVTDSMPRKIFLRAILSEFGLSPKLLLSQDADRTVAFARTNAGRDKIWITVKTVTKSAQNLQLRLDASLLPRLRNAKYRVANLLQDGDTQSLDADTLVTQGFRINLDAEGSTVYLLTPEAKLERGQD